MIVLDNRHIKKRVYIVMACISLAVTNVCEVSANDNNSDFDIDRNYVSDINKSVTYGNDFDGDYSDYTADDYTSPLDLIFANANGHNYGLYNIIENQNNIYKAEMRYDKFNLPVVLYNKKKGYENEEVLNKFDYNSELKKKYPYMIITEFGAYCYYQDIQGADKKYVKYISPSVTLSTKPFVIKSVDGKNIVTVDNNSEVVNYGYNKFKNQWLTDSMIPPPDVNRLIKAVTDINYTVDVVDSNNKPTGDIFNPPTDGNIGGTIGKPKPPVDPDKPPVDPDKPPVDPDKPPVDCDATPNAPSCNTGEGDDPNEGGGNWWDSILDFFKGIFDFFTKCLKFFGMIIDVTMQIAGDIVQGIKDFLSPALENIWDGFTDVMKMLFVPSEATFSFFKDDIAGEFNRKVFGNKDGLKGIKDAYEAIRYASYNSKSLPDIKTTFQGQEITFMTFPDNLQPVLDTTKTILTAFIGFAFVKYNIKRLYKMLRKDDLDVD